MPTLDNLDVPIMDEYDRKEMENLEMVAVENPHYENAIPRYVWDHPDFEDILAWEPINQLMSICEEILVNRISVNPLELGLSLTQKNLPYMRCGSGREVCPWGLRIAALRGSHRWEVRKHRDHHICQNDTIMSNNVHMMPKYVAKELWDVMTEKLWLSGAEIQARIYKDYVLEISPLKDWQAKQQTMINLFGTWDGSFADLPHLMKALVDHSPETVVKWDTEEIDGEYIQVNRDFEHLLNVFMHLSIVVLYYPLTEFICTSNFNTKVEDSYLKKKLGKVAYAKKEYKFVSKYEELMTLLKDRPDVRTWLRNVDVHLWSLAMDTGGMRWGSMTTNASESFNSVLKHGRDLPISALVMFTFKQLNKYFNTRHYRYDNTDSAFAPKRTCECGKWTTLHIPCSHAIVVFHYLVLTSENPMMDFLICLILTSNVQTSVEIQQGEGVLKWTRGMSASPVLKERLHHHNPQAEIKGGSHIFDRRPHQPDLLKTGTWGSGYDSVLLDGEFVDRVCENVDRVQIVVPKVATPSGLVKELGFGCGRKVLCPVPLVVGIEEPPMVPGFLNELELSGWVAVRVDAYETRWGNLKN
ncbi:hypothetical protein QQ045_016298 [Rhodiola kirilowii]